MKAARFRVSGVAAAAAYAGDCLRAVAGRVGAVWRHLRAAAKGLRKAVSLRAVASRAGAVRRHLPAAATAAYAGVCLRAVAGRAGAVWRRLPAAAEGLREAVSLGPTAAAIYDDLVRGRGFVIGPIALGVGAAVALQMPPADPRPAAVAVAALLLLRWRLLDRFLWALALGLAAAALAGVAAVAVAEMRAAEPRLDRPYAGTVTGRVETVEDRDGRGLRVRLAAVAYDPSRRSPLPTHVRVSVRTADPAGLLHPGALVRLPVRLDAPSPPLYPGGYDFARTAWFDGVGGIGYAVGPPVAGEGAGPPDRFAEIRTRVEIFRLAVAARVKGILAGETGAIAAALMVGDRGAIDPATDAAMRVSGLSHVLSISGLHLSLVAFGLFAVLRLLAATVPVVALTLPVKKIAAVVALVAAIGYLLVSGLAVATVRSTIMVAVTLLAVVLDRRALTLRTVALSAVPILLVDPVAVLDPGAQMSFASVAALVAAFEAWRARRPERPPPDVSRLARLAGGFARWILGSMATSLVAGIATAPIALHHFGRIAPLGIVANLLASPVVAFVITPAGLVSAVLMPLGLDCWTLPVMGAGIDAMVEIARVVAAATPGGGGFGRPALAGTLLLTAAGLWAIVFTGRARRLALLPLALGLVLAPTEPVPDLVVSASGRRLLVADGGRLHVLGRPDAFETGIWLAARGAAATPDDPALVAAVRCDPEACILPEPPSHPPPRGASAAPDRPAGSGDGKAATPARAAGRPTRVALVLKPEAFADECATARLVVTALAAPSWCRRLTRVIDAADLAGRGARTYAIEPEAGDDADVDADDYADANADAAAAGLAHDAADHDGARAPDGTGPVGGATRPDDRLVLRPLAAAVDGPRQPWHPPRPEDDADAGTARGAEAGSDGQ